VIASRLPARGVLARGGQSAADAYDDDLQPSREPALTVPILLAVLTGAGVIYAYLRWTSGSIWPVIIAHGTFNAVLGSFAGAAVTPDAAAAAYLTGETGLFTLAGVAVTAFVLAGRYPIIAVSRVR
jgi:membrane protease YdiL (CAAX protease family)